MSLAYVSVSTGIAALGGRVWSCYEEDNATVDAASRRLLRWRIGATNVIQQTGRALVAGNGLGNKCNHYSSMIIHIFYENVDMSQTNDKLSCVPVPKMCSVDTHHAIRHARIHADQHERRAWNV